MKNIEKASNFAHEAVDKIASVSNQTVDAFDEKSEQFLNAEQRMVKKCRSYVRDNPITSLGISAAAGFILSRLMSCR